MMIKYRVHEVGKDFGVNSKVILELLAKYFPDQKNHMSTLESPELDIVFETFTQENAVDSFEKYFATAPKPAEKPERKPEENLAPGGQPARPEENKKPAGAQPNLDKKVRVVDTRGATVDLGKFDERIEQLAPDKAVKVMETTRSVQRFGNRNNKQHGKGGRYNRGPEQKPFEKMVIKKKQLEVSIPDEISVGELASRLKMTGVEVIKKLMNLGVMASLSQVIDYETATIVAEELGAKVEREVVVTIEERLFGETQDSEQNLQPRSPVVVVMGHVDHGKTSLLDAIRDAHVASGEAGGITQHIGAYRVRIHDQDITFLDTPGHEAFTAMRMRGAQVTDIAILVVAADDGIMPQTVEAINHARAAGVSIVVAINKIDRPNANVERVKQELTEYNLVPEEWGGDTICVPVSAVKRENIDTLLEMILLVAEMKNLRANPNRQAHGTVIESRLERGRGPVATVLVQNGTLRTGDSVIAGTSVGRVRVMTDDRGNVITSAGPSVPVEIVGLDEVPAGGDEFWAVADERMARELAEQRKQRNKDEQFKNSTPKVSLDDLFNQIKQGEIKDLNIIVKADVQGSVEAVRQALEKLSRDEVRVRCIHCAVGGINESDVMLATASSAIIVGFNVRPDQGARASAEQNHVDLRTYRIIYDAINEIEAAMKGMLAPKFREVILGHAQIRQTFKVSGVGTIAGCYVQDGKIVRNAKVRVVRDGIVVHEGELSSLKRFKDDVKEVMQGFECGMSIERFNDIKEGDIIEAYTVEEYRPE